MSELDLDAIEAEFSVDCPHLHRRVMEMSRELRRLREENARLKAFAEAVVENFDCDCEELPTGDTCFWCQAKEALRRAKP